MNGTASTVRIVSTTKCLIVHQATPALSEPADDKPSQDDCPKSLTGPTTLIRIIGQAFLNLAGMDNSDELRKGEMGINRV